MKKIKPSTSIEFDRARYETLVRALQIAGSVYGVLGDMVDDGYKKHSDAMEDLESWVLASAAAFGMARVVEIFEGKNVLTDEAMDKYTDDLIEYEEWMFWDVLAHKLTDRELDRRRAAGALKGMTEREIMDLHAELEEKYNEELDAHGIERLSML